MSGDLGKISIDYLELLVRVLKPIRARVFAKGQGAIRLEQSVQGLEEKLELLDVMKTIVGDGQPHSTNWKLRPIEITLEVMNAP